MITKTVTTFCFAMLCVVCQAQTTGSTRNAVSELSAKVAPFEKQNALPSSPAKPATLPQSNPLDVLVATNEDCLFLINDEVKGMALKDAFLYLKLPPGTYRYTAKNPKTNDVYRDSFSVAKQQLNEVFIDMLFAMDEGGAKKAEPKADSISASITAVNEQELRTVQALITGMVTIRKGSFVMGNNRAPSADEAEHRVLLNAFSMGKYEVTQEQWLSLMDYNPSLNRDCARCPVENVTWEEVMKFIRKLNSITNKKFRLPTEAEWEYVARYGGATEIEKAGGVEAFISNTAWSFVNSDHKTHPVGEKLPNAAGIYDLFGNVSEWCMDWYGAFFYKEDDTEKNPEGPPLGKDKIVRGGNYKDYVGDRFRPSFRNKMNPMTKGSEVGFRLVMEDP